MKILQSKIGLFRRPQTNNLGNGQLSKRRVENTLASTLRRVGCLPNILTRQFKAELDFLKWGVKSPTRFPFGLPLFLNLVWIPFLNITFYRIIMTGLVMVLEYLIIDTLKREFMRRESPEFKKGSVLMKLMKERSVEKDKIDGNKLHFENVTISDEVLKEKAKWARYPRFGKALAFCESYERQTEASTTRVSAEAFEAEISKFKQCFGLPSNIHSVHSVFLNKNHLDTIFWASPLFASYLSRKNITFDQNFEPDCSKTEMELYKAIGSYIPYRNPYSISSSTPSSFVKRGGRDTEKNIIDEYMDRLNRSRDNSVSILMNARDIYEIGTLFHKNSDQLCLNYPGRNFILVPCWKDDHAAMVLGIIKNNKVQYAFLVNSWVSPKYLSIMKEKLNTHYLKQNSIPLFEASHPLQKDSDHSCTIYSKNFIYAICKLLNEDKRFAYQLHNANPMEAQKLAKNLVKKMKPYLPMYYKKGNGKRSLEQIRDYHLLERWRMGSEVVKKYHDQAKKKLKLLVTKAHRSSKQGLSQLTT